MRALLTGVRMATVPIVAVIAAACIPTGGEPAIPCDCPQTERILLAIDWLGDGTRATSYESTRRGFEGEELPVVDIAFLDFDDVDDGTGAFARLLRRFEEGGLHVEGIGTVRLETARVVVDSPTDVDSDGHVTRVILIRADLFVDDEHAADALQPIVDALGTID